MAGAREPMPEDVRAATSGQALAKNTLLNLLGLGLPLVVAVFTMPFVVDGLGTARFGILALVWVVLGYMALLDLGLGRATTKFAAEALTTRDYDRVASSARAAAGMQAAVGIAAGAALAVAVPLLVERLLNIPAALVPEARNSFYLLAAVTPILLITNTFRGLLEAAQRFDLVNLVRLPTSTANFLLPLAGVLLDWRLSWIVASMMVVRVVVLLSFFAMARAEYPGLLRPVRAAPGEIRELLSFGGWLTISSLVSPLLVYLDRFAIGALVSLAAVGYYSAPHELVMRLTLLPASMVATLFPALSMAVRLEESDRIQRLVAGSLKFLLIVAGPVLVTLAVLAPDILGLWLGPSFARESGLALRILSVGMLINALTYVANVLLQAVGRPDLPAKFHLVELPVHVLLLWLCINAWGIAGAAAAWTARMVLDSLLLFGASQRLGLLSWEALRVMKVPATAALLVVLGGLLGLTGLMVDRILIRFVVVAVLLAGAGATAWTALLDGDDRERLVLAFRARR